MIVVGALWYSQKPVGKQNKNLVNNQANAFFRRDTADYPKKRRTNQVNSIKRVSGSDNRESEFGSGSSDNKSRSGGTQNQETNVTQEAIRKLLPQALSVVRSGSGSVSTSTARENVSLLANRIEQKAIPAKKVSRSALSVISSPNRKQKERYLSKLFQTSFETLKKNGGDTLHELILLNRLAADKADQPKKTKEKIQQRADFYRTAANDLRALKVPRNYAASHTKLINSLLMTAAAVESFAKIDANPVKSMVAIRQYKSASQKTEKIMSEMVDKLKALPQ